MIKSIKVKFSRPVLLLIFFALFFCLSGCGGSKDESTGTGQKHNNSRRFSCFKRSDQCNVRNSGNCNRSTQRCQWSAGTKDAVVTFAASNSPCHVYSNFRHSTDNPPVASHPLS